MINNLLNKFSRKEVIEIHGKIVSILSDHGFHLASRQTIFNAWNEPHRFYHNIEHLYSLVKEFMKNAFITEKERENLIIAACYHDIIYDPKMLSTTPDEAFLTEPYTELLKNTGWNEFESALVFIRASKNSKLTIERRKK